MTVGGLAQETSKRGESMEIRNTILDAPILTEAGFHQMDDSITRDCLGMPKNIGISVALWRLEALMAGFKVALSHGYQPGGVTVED